MPSEENIKLIFGLKLKQLRTKRKMSPQELAEKSGISNSYLNEIEKGKKYPKTDKIDALANALQVKYDELVSLKLPKDYAAIELLLQSNILSNLPLDMLGFDLNSLVDLLANSPMKINAFLNTIIEIARNHDLQTEYFYFSVLRSYQELKENFFEDTEQAALDFTQLHSLNTETNLSTQDLRDLLTALYDYKFEDLDVQFNQMRSIYKPETNTLYLNPNLNEHQLLFVLGRELAFNYMKLKPRPLVTTYFNNAGFQEIFNNFLASYFATALLLPQRKIVGDLQAFFANEKWNEDEFKALTAASGVSAEMYMHRLTNILPRFFKLNAMFFLRLSKPHNKEQINITKELHIGRLHNPHASSKNLHYCRRWISIEILKDLEAMAHGHKPGELSLVKAQISNYKESKDSYFIISVARSMYPISGYNTSVSIGILMNENFKKAVNFSIDENVIRKEVSEACELCSIQDCKERAADPDILTQREKLKTINQSIEDFLAN